MKRRIRKGLPLMSHNGHPVRGEVWTAWLDPAVGHEQGGRRPVLVVSSDPFNALPHGLVIAAPLTTTNRHLPTHVEISALEAGLSSDSVIMCDQVRAISVERLKKRLGAVEYETLARVSQTIARIIPRDEP